MLRFLLDSAGSNALFVLAKDDKMLGHCVLTPRFGQDRVGVFLDGLQQLCAQHQAHIADIHAISAVVGPGRYTGIRMGLSMVHGLCLGSTIHVKGIRRDFAYAALMNAPTGVILCDSGKAQVYGGVWQNRQVSTLKLLNKESVFNIVTPSSPILALLSQEQLIKGYPGLCARINTIQFPTNAERAEALIQSGDCLFSQDFDSASAQHALFPWYQEQALSPR